ncbi:MAG: hypothetical protein PHS54_02210 [Clostridia bacterium]|nr:hypothetical protein [Clostridia bacterium]
MFIERLDDLNILRLLKIVFKDSEKFCVDFETAKISRDELKKIKVKLCFYEIILEDYDFRICKDSYSQDVNRWDEQNYKKEYLRSMAGIFEQDEYKESYMENFFGTCYEPRWITPMPKKDPEKAN